MSSTTESRQQQRSQLAVQREIRLAEDQLVIWIQERIDAFRIHAQEVRKTATDKRDRNQYGKLEESQFRNLMHVADGTDSPEVVKNFLRYQLGRDNKWGKGPDSLAEKIIAHIGEAPTEEENAIEQPTSGDEENASSADTPDDNNISTLAELAEHIAKNAKSHNFKLIWMDLIRRYIGFGGRHLVYVNKGGGR
ncbi:MAG: hypothetical protein AAGI69_12600 [Cyanobacteria bacterium P01_H01_bin.21]